MADDAENFGHITFAGVTGIRGTVFSFPTGIQPGVLSLETRLQRRPVPHTGAITVRYGSTRLEFPRCRVVDGSLRRSTSGRTVSLQVQDRRWMWAFGQVSGEYNRRDEAGEVIASTEKTPRELAALCLDALGERNYDTSALPNEPRPPIRWDASNPARALEDLCHTLGCVVVLTLTDRVVLAKMGQGAQLPEPKRIDYGVTVDTPELPDKVAVLLGATEYQLDLELEAVGEEEDGEIVLLDDLSFTPAEGWGFVDLENFAAVADGVADEDKAARMRKARESVFRLYRIKIPDGGLEVPSFTDETGQKVERHDHIEPLDVQNDTLPGAPETRRAAIIYGSFVDQQTYDLNPPTFDVEPFDPGTTPESQRFQGSWSYDQRRSLIVFGEPMFRYKENSTEYEKEPAVLRLRAACRVRYSDTHAYDRKARERRLATGNGLGTPTAFLAHNEIVLRVTVRYRDDFSVESIETNAREAVDEADHYLDAWVDAQRTETPEQATYAGLLRVELDGAIRHVTWKTSTAGATTEVARNTELTRYTPPYRSRRASARVADAAVRDKSKAIAGNG